MKRIFHLNNYVRTYSALARARKTLSPGERDVSSYSARAFPPGKPVRFSPRRKSVRLTAVFGTPKKGKGKKRIRKDGVLPCFPRTTSGREARCAFPQRQQVWNLFFPFAFSLFGFSPRFPRGFCFPQSARTYNQCGGTEK